MSTYKANRCKTRRARAIACIRLVRATLDCQVCQEKDPIVLELHHVIPIGKERTRSYQSLTVLERDLSLCTVVCANCHLRISVGVIDSPPAMGDISKTFTAPFRRKTTYTRGYDNPKTKLTPLQVDEIRNLHPQLSYNKIAARFGIAKNTVINVVKKRAAYIT